MGNGILLALSGLLAFVHHKAQRAGADEGDDQEQPELARLTVDPSEWSGGDVAEVPAVVAEGGCGCGGKERWSA